MHRRLIHDVLHDRQTGNAPPTSPPPSCAIDDIHYNIPSDHPRRVRLQEIRNSFINADGSPDEAWTNTCDHYLDSLANIEGARDPVLYPIVTVAKAGEMNRNAAFIESYSTPNRACAVPQIGHAHILPWTGPTRHHTPSFEKA